MLPVAGRPLLEHLLVEVARAGIKEFIFVTGYQGEQVHRYFSDGHRWGVRIDYCPQSRQMGTADAIKMVEGLFKGNFLVMNGDILTSREDIGRLASHSTVTMGIARVDDVRGLGVVEISGGRVTRIYEKLAKPPSHQANAGMYLFTPDIFEAIARTGKSKRGEYEITDSLQLMIDKGIAIDYQEISRWQDLGYPWDLLSANESLLEGMEGQRLGQKRKMWSSRVLSRSVRVP